MTEPATCGGFHPGECEGTVHCPPRCPRYVSPDGTAYTIHERVLEEPVQTAGGSGDGIDADPAADGEHTAANGADADDVRDAVHDVPSGPVALVAVREDDPADEAVGRARPNESPEQGGGADAPNVSIEADDDAIAAELVRQSIARRLSAESDADRLAVTGPVAALERVGAELGDAARYDTEGETLLVTLDDPAATRLALPPARRSDVPAGRDLSALLEPECVAVVGATDREGSIGRIVVENLASAFEGEVIPVTPRWETVCGLDAVESVPSLETDTVDLALVILPADAAVEAVRELAAVDVGAVAVLSAGFAETGEDGVDRERELRAVVDDHDLLLVGPNALGVVSTRRSMNASFAPTLPGAGSVSILSHSGAMVTALLEWADRTGVGVRDVVSVGNAVGIDEADLLRHWGRDPGTDVVLAYLEDVEDGRAFVEAAREVTRTTPVVALKSGRSEAGRAAAASHTGALAGDDAGFDAAFEAAGVLRADSRHELCDLGLALSSQPLPSGNRVAVVTNAGGPGVLATDAVAATDCTLATFEPSTIERLETALPSAASVDNPLDVLGDADVDRFVEALEVVLADPGVDAAMIVSTPHPLVSRSALVAGVADAGRRYGTPVVTCLAGANAEFPVASVHPDGTHRRNSSDGIHRPTDADGTHPPNYPDAKRAAAVLAAMARAEAYRRRPDRQPDDPPFDHEEITRMLDERVGDDQRPDSVVLGIEHAWLLEAVGIEAPPTAHVRSPEAARKAAADVEDRVALKVASPDLAHKSDVGGVVLDVDPTAAGEAYEKILETVDREVPGATLDGAVVQGMADPGVECLVGVTRHPRFGPMVTVGIGGTLVEHLDDVAHALAPVTPGVAEGLLDRLELSTLLAGARGEEPVDRETLVDAIVRLSWLPVVVPAVRELEVNPLLSTSEGAVAVDLLARLGDPAED